MTSVTRLNDDEIMLKLVRNFTIIGLVSMVTIMAILGAMYREMSVSQLVQHSQRESIVFSQLLGHIFKDEYKLKLSGMEAMTASELRLHPNSQLLNKFIHQHSKGLNILQVNIYALNGNTLYATDTRQLGLNQSSLSVFETASAGRIISELVSYDRLYTLNGVTQNYDTVSSYIPVNWSEDNGIDAIVHISADVTAVLIGIEGAKDKVYLYSGLILFVLFIILMVMIKYVDKNIQLNTNEIERQQKEITWHAYRDSLTGLPNRSLFIDRLEHAMHGVRQREKLLAVLYLDLDRFKSINDSLGYAVGDELLVKVAERLKRCIHHRNTVSRLGGDEFAIVLEDITTVDEAGESATQIMTAMSAPFNINQHEVFVTFSIGIALYPFDDMHTEQLLQKADASMYQAKEAGRNTYCFYCSSEKEQLVSRFVLENELRGAIEHDEFELYYQPVVQLKTGRIMAVEALLRWNSPTQGLVTPVEFISVLEDTGLIIPVGKWVLETACEQCVQWQKQGYEDLKMNINISAKQFRHADMLRQVTDALDSSSLPAHLLNIEITESLLIENRDEAIRILDELNEKGIAMSIDDFGTGYSSMAYLKRMPIGTIKIDKSFIRGIPHNMDDVSIVRAVTSLSQNLRLNVIAEGVETDEQLAFLHQLNVFGMQGYLMSPPVPSSDMVSLLESHNPLLFAG